MELSIISFTADLTNSDFILSMAVLIAIPVGIGALLIISLFKK